MAQRRSGRRPDYSWSGQSFVHAAMGTTTVATSLFTIGLASTIVRFRGRLRGYLNTAAAADSEKLLACGLILLNADTAAAGAASMPEPLSDRDADWIWTDFLTMATVDTTEGSGGGMQFDTIVLDNKSMRRARPSEVVVFVCQPVDLGGTETATVFGGLSMLLSS